MEIVIENKPTKILLKEEAQRLFRLNGYPATSMRQLASAIDIEPASIYSHYRSKEEILKTIIFEMAGNFFKAIEKQKKEVCSADVKLRNYIQAHIEVIALNSDASAVFFHDWRHLDEGNLNQFKILRAKYETYFKAVLSEGIESKVFRQVEVKFTMLTIFSALNWTYEWYQPDGKLDYHKIADNISDILVHGLATH